MNPIRLNDLRSVALLHEDYVGRNLSSGIFLERVVRKTNRTEQIGALSYVFPDVRRLFVHRVSARDKHNHAAWSDLIESFREKIVVDREIELIVRLVVDLVAAERHISDRKIEKVTSVCCLKACDCNVSFRIELLRDSASD